MKWSSTVPSLRTRSDSKGRQHDPPPPPRGGGGALNTNPLLGVRSKPNKGDLSSNSDVKSVHCGSAHSTRTRAVCHSLHTRQLANHIPHYATSNKAHGRGRRLRTSLPTSTTLANIHKVRLTPTKFANTYKVRLQNWCGRELNRNYCEN
jgi:hypothetical protein